MFAAAPVLDYLDRLQTDQAVAAAMRQGSDKEGEESSGFTEGEAGDGSKRSHRAKAGDATYQYLVAYNRRVRSGAGGAVNDPWGLGSQQSELDRIGLPDGMIGSVRIPAMNVRLPLYLGSTKANLARGATVVAGTSAPLGEPDSNSVIAAHRGGYHGNRMFLDIENVKVGDLVYVDTLWDSFVYRAEQIRVVPMSDVSSVALQPGRDMITLLTCDPYIPTGGAKNRYLVYCVRDRAAEAQVRAGADEDTALNGLLDALNPLSSVQAAVTATDSPWLAVERWARVAGLALLVVMVVELIVCRP